MTQEKFDNEKEIRRFLLGGMTDDERTAFEQRFLAGDDGLFDEISVTEDELIESYLRETLSAVEKTKFESNFLISGNRRRRVAFTREMFDKLTSEKPASVKKTGTVAENKSVPDLIISLFKNPRFAFGAVLAVLLLVFGFWLLVLKNSESKNEIAQQITPTPAVFITPQKVDETNRNPVNVSNVNPSNKPETNKNPSNINAEMTNKAQPKETIPKTVTAAIALFTGTIRSEGKVRELNLTKGTKGANFELNLESRDYQNYRAEIVDADGAIVYRSGKINARKLRINTYFPTAKLKKGDYFVKLYGFNSSGEEESAADFQFRVNQK